MVKSDESGRNSSGAVQAVWYPAVWKNPIKVLRIGAVGFFVISLVFLFVAVSGDVIGYLYAIVCLAIAAVAISFGSWPRAGRAGAHEARVRSGRLAMVSALPRWRAAILALFLVALLPFFVMLAVGGPELVLDSESSRRAVARVTLVVALSPYFAAALALLALAFFLGKRKMLGVGMDVDGVYHWWWGGCSFYPWERMSGVWLVRPQAGPRVELRMRDQAAEPNPEENWLGRMVWMRQRQRRIQLGLFRVHPGVTYQALCFYLRHPELREELNDGRALERMRAGDYGEIIDEIRRHGRALNPDE